MDMHEKFAAASAEYLRRIRFNNLSPQTLRNYESVLARFGAFLAEYDGNDMYAAVEAWRDSMAGVSPASVGQYLTTLKIFFDKATRRSFPAELRYTENPVDEDMKPKVPKRPYKTVLTDEQVKLLYRNEKPDYFTNWPRNWAMLMLLLNEKIRNAELLDLKLSDIDMANHVVTVQSGKGRKWREVDMCDLTELALEQYLNSGIRPAALLEDDFLFGTTAAHEAGNITTRTGAEKWHRGTTNWLSNVVERTVRAVTGVSGVRSHDMRRIGSRVCLNAGQSLEELQGQLGHSQITTTQIYTSRMGSRRSRESARSVLAAREEAAEILRTKNQKHKKLVTLTA